MGWSGFWIGLALLLAVEQVLDYMRWKTKALYDLPTKKCSFWCRNRP